MHKVACVRSLKVRNLRKLQVSRFFFAFLSNFARFLPKTAVFNNQVATFTGEMTMIQE